MVNDKGCEWHKIILIIFIIAKLISLCKVFCFLFPLLSVLKAIDLLKAIDFIEGYSLCKDLTFA